MYLVHRQHPHKFSCGYWVTDLICFFSSYSVIFMNYIEIIYTYQGLLLFMAVQLRWVFPQVHQSVQAPIQSLKNNSIRFNPIETYNISQWIVQALWICRVRSSMTLFFFVKWCTSDGSKIRFTWLPQRRLFRSAWHI